MSTDYDVIILGGGPAGEHCAGRLANGGLRVAVVERELVGGECSYWACIPSKTLLRAGEAVRAAQDATAHASLDVAATLAWRDYMVSDYSDAGQEKWLADAGIDLVRGVARLAGPGAVVVGDTTYTARDVVVATGSESFMPPVPGLDFLEGVWTNREATALTAVPQRLVVLGGGPVGVEMAQAVRRLGAEVVLISRDAQLLPREPAPLGEAAAEVLRRDGVEVLLGAEPVAAGTDRGDFFVDIDGGQRVSGDRLLVATGRRPRVEGIGLETVGVDPNPRGIAVDRHLRAGRGVWAIGDVNGQWPTTYVAKYQGDVVAANILGVRRSVNYDAVPRVVFTDPQVAAVGVGDAPFSATADISEVARPATFTRKHADSIGFLTLLSDGSRLTGAYAVGPEAGEWLQQATLAIRARVPLKVLRDVIQPFPTFSEIYIAALDEMERAIGIAESEDRRLNWQRYFAPDAYL